MSKPVDWDRVLAGIQAALDSHDVSGARAPTFIKRLVHDYLVNNGDDLVAIGVALDRSYLAPWIGKVFDDETIPDIVRAIAEAFIAEGLEQTS